LVVIENSVTSAISSRPSTSTGSSTTPTTAPVVTTTNGSDARPVIYVSRSNLHSGFLCPYNAGTVDWQAALLSRYSSWFAVWLRRYWGSSETRHLGESSGEQRLIPCILLRCCLVPSSVVKKTVPLDRGGCKISLHRKSSHPNLAPASDLRWCLSNYVRCDWPKIYPV
jgi:hypothetical protein